MKYSYSILRSLIISNLLVATPLLASAAEVNVYSYRKPKLIDPMFAEFTKQTGIKVNSVYAKKGMLEKLQSEGRNSPADLVFTVDIGRLSDIHKAGLTQSVNRERFAGNIPDNYMAPHFKKRCMVRPALSNKHVIGYRVPISLQKFL